MAAATPIVVSASTARLYISASAADDAATHDAYGAITGKESVGVAMGPSCADRHLGTRFPPHRLVQLLDALYHEYAA